MKSWSQKEKALVDWLNEVGVAWEAVRRSRALRGEAVEDIEFGPLSVELKTGRKLLPKYILSWLDQAETNCEDRIPVVVAHNDRMRKGEQVVILRFQDFVRLLELHIERGEDG
jgi:hypothetical protein